MRAPARLPALLLLVLAAVPARVAAQPDEIQVHDGGLAARGKFNLTLHTNFPPTGLTTPAFAGAFVPDQSPNGAGECAYGDHAWFAAGLYLRLSRVGATDGHRRAVGR